MELVANIVGSNEEVKHSEYPKTKRMPSCEQQAWNLKTRTFDLVTHGDVSILNVGERSFLVTTLFNKVEVDVNNADI